MVIWSFKAKILRNEILKYWNKRKKSTRFSKKLKLKIKHKTNQLKRQIWAEKLKEQIEESLFSEIIVLFTFQILNKLRFFYFGKIINTQKNYYNF